MIRSLLNLFRRNEAERPMTKGPRTEGYQPIGTSSRSTPPTGGSAMMDRRPITKDDVKALSEDIEKLNRAIQELREQLGLGRA
jgi:hypothetical protein